MTQRGIIKWFDDKKGFGFITPEDGSADVFLHYSAIIDDRQNYKTVTEGRPVEYTVARTPKGLQAVDVVKLTE